MKQGNILYVIDILYIFCNNLAFFSIISSKSFSRNKLMVPEFKLFKITKPFTDALREYNS